MSRHMHRRRAACATAVCLGAAALLAHGPAHAQSELPQQTASGTTASTKPRLWIEPSLQVQAAVNHRAEGGGFKFPLADRTGAEIQVSPGLRVVGDLPKARFSVDYVLTGATRSRHLSDAETYHRLNSLGQFELADNTLFLDVQAQAARQAVSALGAPFQSTGSDANQAQTWSGQLSPYVKGTLPGQVNALLRHTVGVVGSDAANRADTTTHQTALSLGRQVGTSLGWAVDVQHQTLARDLNLDDTSLSSANATVSYALASRWLARVSAGAESTDRIEGVSTRYTNWGLGLEWKPSGQAVVGADVGRRYFGSYHDVRLEWRGPRSSVRFSDTRDVVDTPENSVTQSVGTLYQLFDTLLASELEDPVARAQVVEALLRQNGLTGDELVQRSFLYSQSTVQRTRTVSVLWSRPRQSLGFNVSHADVRRLQKQRFTAGDDLDVLSSVRTLNWNVLFTHRLTPRMSVSVSHARSRPLGDEAAVGASSQSTQVGLNAALGARTSGSVQLRHTSNKSSVSPYAETALVGNLLHRF